MNLFYEFAQEYSNYLVGNLFKINIYDINKYINNNVKFQRASMYAYGNFLIIHFEDLKINTDKQLECGYVELLKFPKILALAYDIFDFHIFSSDGKSANENGYLRCFDNKLCLYISDPAYNFDGTKLSVYGYTTAVIPIKYF